MKSMKVAAVVAGSLAVVGSAGSAFAAGGMGGSPVPTSLNGGVETLANEALTNPAPPTVVQTDALDPQSKDSLFHTVSQATGSANKTNGIGPGALLGGLPIPH